MSNVVFHFYTWIVVLFCLSACGLDETSNSDQLKKYMTFDLRMVGLAADFTAPQRLDSAQIKIHNCTNDKMNKTVEINNFTQPQTLMLEADPTNCQIALIQFVLSGKSQKESFTAVEKSSALSLNPGQRSIYSSNLGSRVEVIIEPVSNTSSSRWFTYRIAFKPELAGRSRALNTSFFDFNTSEDSSFLFVSKVNFRRATKNKERSAYAIELSCPQKMVETKCKNWSLLEHEFFVLNEEQMKLEPESLISFARTSIEPIRPKTSDIVGSTFRLLMITESKKGEAVGLLDLWQDQARFHTMTLPK